jgi:hypothetical protein
MQAKLLAKIEELTLHLIQQEKDNRELQERIAWLEKGKATPDGPITCERPRTDQDGSWFRE